MLDLTRKVGPDVVDHVGRADIIQSIERCFAVLEAFERVPRDATSTSRLAAETSLPRPVVRRILLTLTSLGYARPDGPYWRLEPALMRFSSLYVESSSLIVAARSHVDELSQKFGETVAISQREGLIARIVYASNVDHFLRLRAEVGQPLPLHATSPGHVMLAWLGITANQPLQRYTAHTITERADLEALVAEVRSAGFSICDQELEDGLIDAAVPVLDPAGAFLGTLSLATSVGRHSATDMAQTVVPALRETALRITLDIADLDRPA